MAEEELPAPIKAEFLRERWTPPSRVPPAPPREQLAPQKKKSRRSPWVGGKPGSVPNAPVGLCRALASKGECAKGDACFHSHDLEAFRRERPAELERQCYVFATHGYCRDGAKCRMSASHVDAHGRNIVDEAKEAAWRANRRESPGMQVIKQLSRKKYSFQVAPVALQTVKRHDQALQIWRSNGEGDRPKPELRERAPMDIKGKLMLAPLTTIGNLPFRRVCVELGAEITCGEMALARNLISGNRGEWALTQRHPSEKFFGVQIAGRTPDEIAKAVELVEAHTDAQYIELNVGCPIDGMYDKGLCSALLDHPNRLNRAIHAASQAAQRCPVTIKARIGTKRNKPTLHTMAPLFGDYGLSALGIHGRTREQRYSAAADWDYIAQCASVSSVPVIGKGDIYEYEHWYTHLEVEGIETCQLARGAIIKPWLFTEIRERRHWDISSSERFELLRKFTNYGFEHWGSDWQGVEKTRQFLLQWLSFLHRYVPIGLLDRVPSDMRDRPSPFVGRDDLETLMGSPYSEDWVAISEMLLGPAPSDFEFKPKHKSNAYEISESNEWGCY